MRKQYGYSYVVQTRRIWADVIVRQLYGKCDLCCVFTMVTK